MPLDPLPTLITQCSRQIGVSKHALERFRQRVAVARRHYQTTVGDHLCQGTTITRYQGNAGGHGLNRRQTETLIEGGDDRYRALRIETIDLFMAGVTDTTNVVNQPKALNERFGISTRFWSCDQ